MNFKLKGRTLLNADTISPDIPYAEFSDGISIDTINRIVNNMNCGHIMLMLYKQHRDNLHITNVVTMLEKMEEVYHMWYNKDYEIRKRG